MIIVPVDRAVIAGGAEAQHAHSRKAGYTPASPRAPRQGKPPRTRRCAAVYGLLGPRGRFAACGELYVALCNVACYFPCNRYPLALQRSSPDNWMHHGTWRHFLVNLCSSRTVTEAGQSCPSNQLRQEVIYSRWHRAAVSLLVTFGRQRQARWRIPPPRALNRCWC